MSYNGAKVGQTIWRKWWRKQTDGECAPMMRQKARKDNREMKYFARRDERLQGKRMLDAALREFFGPSTERPE